MQTDPMDSLTQRFRRKPTVGLLVTTVAMFFLFSSCYRPWLSAGRFQKSLTCDTTPEELADQAGNYGANFRWEPGDLGLVTKSHDSFIFAFDDSGRLLGVSRAIIVVDRTALPWEPRVDGWRRVLSCNVD
jgi:hypothetical protein